MNLGPMRWQHKSLSHEGISTNFFKEEKELVFNVMAWIKTKANKVTLIKRLSQSLRVDESDFSLTSLEYY